MEIKYICPKCGSDWIIKSGMILKAGGRVQARSCNACGYRGSENAFVGDSGGIK